MWFLRRQEVKSGDDAKKALVESEQQLLEVQGRAEEVTVLSQAIRELRERNHFSERLEQLIMQTRGSHR